MICLFLTSSIQEWYFVVLSRVENAWTFLAVSGQLEDTHMIEVPDGILKEMAFHSIK